MHFRRALLAVLIAVCCADTVVGRHSPWVRRDPSGAASKSVSNTNAPPAGKPTTGNVKNGSTKTAQTKTTSVKGGGTPTTTALSGGHSNGTANSPDEELPIQPSITPAVAISGVILIITGIAYTLMGIKHEWLLVFLSTAYLASLGITVLVIYVMNPPVSNAIQGAYFVAAFMTGILFGGLSLIFQEVARGFGCIVGGFCLAMWLLCLKSGGLITSTAGRAIMIGGFCAVGWSLAFSQYTRTYGSIFCTSFGGAMITIIGIDCFTRAGLKEFWIYIWDLNQNEFPLHTRTYPITRGMRAELACTVVLCVIGLISQMKVWKIVRDRRAKKEEERQQDESSRDKRDSQYGRAVELRNSRSLAAWEAVYGDNQAGTETETTLDSLKKSPNVLEREVDSIELEDMNKSGKHNGKKRRSFATSSGTKDGEVAGTARELHPEHKSSNSIYSQSEQGSIDRAEPPIPALPFSLLSRTVGVAPSDNGSRYGATTPAQETHTVASSELPQNDHDDKAYFGVELIEDDRASSVAATMDEDPDFDALSTNRLSRFSLAASMYSMKGLSAPEEVPPMPGDEPIEDDDDEELVKPALPTEKSSPKPKKDKSNSEQKDEDPNLAKINETNLPGAISKVAHVYRTNEWAKHVAEADEPEVIEENLNNDEPAVHIDVGRTEETPRPVDVRALSPEQLEPQFFRTASNPYRTSSKEQKQPSSSATPIYSFQRQSSTASLNQTKREFRNTAKSPIPQTLVESPIEDSLETPGTLMDERNLRVQSRATTTNFNSIIPSAVRSVPSLLPSSVQAQDSAPPPAVRSAISPSPSTIQLQDSTPTPSDDMPLSQRKSLIAQSQLPSEQPRPFRSSSALAQYSSPSSRFSTSNQNLIYNSHQPQRFNSVNHNKQNAMLAQWRQSLQQELYAQPAFNTGVHERAASPAVVDQQRYQEYQEKQQQAEKEKRESKMEQVRWSSNLMERHKSALRKMQAQANEADKS